MTPNIAGITMAGLSTEGEPLSTANARSEMILGSILVGCRLKGQECSAVRCPEFASYKEAQDYAKRTGRVCLLECATNPHRLLSPDQYDTVNVRTSRGVKQAILVQKAALKALWAADAPFREAMAIKRERLRALKKKRAAQRVAKKDLT